jgi:hypothetical protein
LAYFVLIGRDHAGLLELRKSLRPAHQAHFFTPQPDCRAVAGGPVLGDDGEMNGSLLVFDAADRAAVERFFLNGLFETVEILPWRWGFGSPTNSAP